MLAVAFAAALVLWPQPASRVTRANFDRIHIGTDRAELEAILGPPGDYRTGPGESNLGDDKASRWIPDPNGFEIGRIGWLAFPNFIPVAGIPTTGRQATWVSDSARVWVAIDDAGRVQSTDISDRRLIKGPVDRLFWRVRRQWRRWFQDR